MSIYGGKKKRKGGIAMVKSFELGGGGKWNHGKKMKAKAKGKRNLKRAA